MAEDIIADLVDALERLTAAKIDDTRSDHDMSYMGDVNARPQVREALRRFLRKVDNDDRA